MRAVLRSVRPLLAMFFVAGVAGCGLQLPTPGMMGVGQGESHRVGYVVRCRECRVFFTEGREREEVAVVGSWSRTVRIRDPETRVVRLTAVPSRTPGYIEHAYIEIDGAKVAEERRNGTSPSTDQVTLSAPIPVGR